MSLRDVRRSSPFVGMTSLERSAVLLLFLTVAGIVGVANLGKGDSSLALTYVSFVIYLATLSLPLVLYRAGWGWFHPLIVTCLWWGLARNALPAMGVIANGLIEHRALNGWSRSQLDLVVVESMMLESLAMICVLVGYFVTTSRRLALNLVLPRPSAIVLKVASVAAVSCVGLLLLVHEAGGFVQLLLQRGLPADERVVAEIGSHWVVLVNIFKAACLVWLVLVPRNAQSRVFWFVFLVALAMSFAVTGSRSQVLVPALMAISIWCLYRSTIPYRLGAGLLIISIAAIGLLGEFRLATRGAQTLDDVSVETGFVEGLGKGLGTFSTRADELSGTYGILGKVPDHATLLMGTSYLSIPAAPIPRVLWNNKPQAGGILNAELIFNEPLTAIPPGNVGEAYWNFHIPGVILVHLLWGVLLRLLFIFYRDNAGYPAPMLLYIATLFLLQPNSESFYHWAHMVAPALIFLIYFCGFPRRRSPTRAALQSVPA